MTITTLSSREFNQDVGRAKKAASEGPVFITDRGKLSHVLLTFEEYRRLKGSGPTLLEVVAQEDDFEFDPPRLGDELVRPADFD
jgi:hypothetical protein